MSIKPLLTLFVICLVSATAGHTQETTASGSVAEQEQAKEGQKTLSEEQQKKAKELEKQAAQKAEEQRKKEVARKTKPPKEVFKPTEEISEDSPVPFPIDI